jgi:hypothetical protein
VHSQNDSRDDRKFENLPLNWIVVLGKALETALRERAYRKNQSDVSNTLESLRRVKGARSGDEASFMTPSDRPWRHVWEVERLKRSLMLLEAKPEFKADWPLAKELRA